MTARIAILAATIMTLAPAAQPLDVAALAVAVAHVERMPVDVRSILAVAYVETGGTMRPGLVSRAGACGVMQCLPKWSALTCEEMGSPLGGVVAGVTAWHYWQGRSGRHSVAEMYNGGNRPGFRASIYARQVAKQRRRLAHIMGER